MILRAVKALAWAFVSAIGLYVIAALCVLDFTSSAIHGDWEYDVDRRPVAFGRRPRYPFDRGANLDIPGGWDYSGDEPVFTVFAPVCWGWRIATGHVLPPADPSPGS